MRCGEREDRWYVLENHADWKMCLYSVPRLAIVERSSSVLWSAQLRGRAHDAHCTFRQFPVVSSISVSVR